MKRSNGCIPRKLGIQLLLFFDINIENSFRLDVIKMTKLSEIQLHKVLFYMQNYIKMVDKYNVGINYKKFNKYRNKKEW